MVPDATNAASRHGIAIAWDDGDNRVEWIFNKKTLEFLGDRNYNTKTGVVYGESAIVQRAFTDKAGQLP